MADLKNGSRVGGQPIESQPGAQAKVDKALLDAKSYTDSHIGTGGSAHAVASTGQHGFMSSTDKAKLDGISTNAKKVEDSATNGNIKIDGIETNVYTHPTTHAATMITQDTNNRFVTDTEKATWNGKLDATANAVSASKLATARTITLAGDVSGSVSFDGTTNVSFTTTVADDSHNHIIANVDGLQTALDGKLSTSGTAVNSQSLDGKDSTAFYQRQSLQIVSGSDWNTFTDAGTYKVQGAVNTNTGAPPFTYAYGLLLVDKALDDSENRVTQTYIPHNSSSDKNIYIRMFNSSAWTGWRIIPATTDGRTVWHSENDGAGSGLDADMVDGMSPSVGNVANTLVYRDGSGNFSAGTITAALSGNATSASYSTRVQKTDDRDVKPVDTPKGFLTPYFTSLEGLTGAAGTNYQDLLVLNNYTDTSGGSVNALSFDKSGMYIYHYQASQDATTWGTPKTLAYTDSSITGNAATATKLQTARTISLTGDVTGSVSFDGTANASITATVADDSHNHIISNIDGLQTALDDKISRTGDSMTGSLLFKPPAGGGSSYLSLYSNGDIDAWGTISSQGTMYSSSWIESSYGFKASNGANIHLQAAAGTDSGDIVFENSAGTEIGRIWYAGTGDTFYARGSSGNGGQVIDLIVSSGTNANGSYIRYLSGIQICFFRTQGTLNNYTWSGVVANGANYWYTTYTWTFPAAFLSGTTISLSASGDIGGAAPEHHELYYVSHSQATAEAGQYAQPNPGASTGQFHRTFMAIGWWK